MPKNTSAKKKISSKKERKQTKADFVRSMPTDMSAKDVIAKGKEAGISLTEDAVYKTRSLDKARTKKKSSGKAKGTVKSASTKKATGNGSAKPRGKSPDKKNRVLELASKHPDWPKSKIAEAVGCTPNYVYSVLNEGAHGTSRKSGAASASNGVVTAFYRAVKSVGVAKAKELLANIEAYENA